MSLLNTREGFPLIRRQTFDSDGDVVDFRGITQHVVIRSADPIHIYFNQDDATADMNYIEIPGVDNSNSFTMGINVRFIWIRAQAGSADVEVIATMRVGN